MVILERKVGQEIVVEATGCIRIIVVKAEHDKVRLAISHPGGLRIDEEDKGA